MKIHILEAGTGDAFIVDCGEGRILIDGGTRKTSKKIKTILTQHTDSIIKGIFVSHVDRDHVGGIVTLFDKYSHLIPKDAPIYINHPNGVGIEKNNDGLVTFEDGDTLKSLIDSGGYKIKNLMAGDRITLDDIHVDILTPDEILQDSLFDIWKEQSTFHNNQNGLVGGDVIEVDCSIDIDEPKEALKNDLINASSIAFTLRHKNKVALFLSDSIPSIITEKIPENSHFDIVKISHHGSKNNTSMSLLKRIKCNSFIISTNGPGNYGHPHSETLVRIIRSCLNNGYSDCNLYFNYKDVCDRIIIKNKPKDFQINLKFTNFVSV